MGFECLLQVDTVVCAVAAQQNLQEPSYRDVDEYSDDNDPGYTREHIRGQDAFIAREIDPSDEDASQQGLKLYHEARGLKDLHWVRNTSLPELLHLKQIKTLVWQK